jgi:hypothetical protein
MVTEEILENIGYVSNFDGIEYRNKRQVGETKERHIERLLDEVTARRVYEESEMIVLDEDSIYVGEENKSHLMTYKKVRD